MKLTTFIATHAVLLLFFGLGFLVAPIWMLSIYGSSSNSTGLLTARVFGIGNIQLSMIMWTFRNDVGSKLLKTLVLLLFLGNALAFMLALQAQIAGIFNVLGWTNVALYLLFSLGYGYFQFIHKGDRDTS